MRAPIFETECSYNIWWVTFYAPPYMSKVISLSDVSNFLTFLNFRHTAHNYLAVIQSLVLHILQGRSLTWLSSSSSFIEPEGNRTQ